MKKLLFIPTILGFAMITSCGPSPAEIEARNKAVADSIATVEAEHQKAVEDSIATAMAAEQAAQAMADSLRQVEVADSMAAAATKKGKK